MKFGPTRGNILLIFEHFVKDFGLVLLLLLVTIWKGPEIVFENMQFVVLVFINPIAVLVKYLFTKYSIDDEKMIINSGLFVKKTMEIPLKAMTTVDLSQNLLFQIFQVYKIKADNSSQTNDTAKQAEVVLALKKEEAFFVKGLLESKGDLKEQEEIINQKDEVLQPVITCTATDFILLGVLQSKLLYIITTFSAVFGGGTYIFSILFEEVDPSALIEKVMSMFSPAEGIAILVLVVYILGAISSAIVTVFRYFNYTVKNRKDALIVEFGLFTKKSYTLKKEKISGVTIKQSILMRVFGYCTVEVFIIGYGDSSEGNNKELSILYPIAKLNQVNHILNEILPDMSFERNYHKAEKKSLRYFFYCTRLFFVIGIIVGISIESTILHISTSAYIFEVIGACVALLIITIISVFLEYLNSGIYANTKVVSICSGILAKKMTFIKTNQIESVSQSTNTWKKKRGFTTIKLGFLAPMRVSNIKAKNVAYKQFEEVNRVLIL
ncbi:PH domain-containing protein [[Clostridium] fimetarium]|uniref:Uncharacterized membrane protein YdbT, contains bPH2 (Pleckstrin homology) domain n=1 Tax=[Clostridium] fimetarium TaxID=99656 RepID=A0A1I0RME2_9FIRM|nr:PH domain-containing protein [[Clostridium] fimetarium]SEW42291.1 Uncharacterized membrane protein YdbT, contains bPH2 (pleckstrin homology) domain [[Clostridium] fimetarium]